MLDHLRENCLQVFHGSARRAYGKRKTRGLAAGIPAICETANRQGGADQGKDDAHLADLRTGVGEGRKLALQLGERARRANAGDAAGCRIGRGGRGRDVGVFRKSLGLAAFVTVRHLCHRAGSRPPIACFPCRGPAAAPSALCGG
ncbi:hypothetical protein MPLA_2130050 [Mesorhizobium sp. ORS 3359]|nr:hypothetical protein MPLA_2130050 [Mesorhizobium sp. ORS 3359]